MTKLKNCSIGVKQQTLNYYPEYMT